MGETQGRETSVSTLLKTLEPCSCGERYSVKQNPFSHLYPLGDERRSSGEYDCIKQILFPL